MQNSDERIRESFDSMRTMIEEVIFKTSVNAQAKVDMDCSSSTENFIFLISKLFAILDLIVNKTDQKFVSDRDFDSQMLLWQAGNSLIGSMQLIRQGYTLEPLFLVRYAVENLSMVLSFYSKDIFYKQFQKNNLSGEKCIGEAKKLVSQMGQIYGLLSEITHPSKKTLGYIYLEGRGTLLIGGGVVDSTIYRVKFNLAILNFITTIFWSSAELVFNDYLGKLDFWQSEGERFTWKPNKENEKVYKHSLDLFKQAISGIDVDFDENDKEIQKNNIHQPTLTF